MKFLSNCLSKMCRRYFLTSCKKYGSELGHQKFLVENSYKNLPIINQTKKTKSILATKSSDELLHILGKQKGKLETSELAASCHKLCEHAFNMLKMQPWAIDSEAILWVQSKTNTGVDKLFLHILHTPEFSTIIQEVKNNISVFSSHELLIVTKSLILLHLSPENEVLVALLCECIERMPSFRISELSLLSVIADRLRHNGVPLLLRIIQAFQENFELENFLCADLDSFKSFSELLSNTNHYLSEPFLVRVLWSCKLLVERHTADELIPYEGSMLRCLLILRFFSEPDEALVETFTSFFLENIGVLGLRSLGRACIYINLICRGKISNSSTLSQLFQERAFEYLDYKLLSPKDVIYVANITQSTMPNEKLICKVNYALGRVLKDFDAFLLNDFIKTAFFPKDSPFLKVRDEEVMHKFSSCIIKKLHDITDAVSIRCLENAVVSYSFVKYDNRSFHLRLHAHLTSEVQFGLIGLKPDTVSNILKYIFFVADESCFLPMLNTLSERFCEMVPQFPIVSAIDLLVKLHELHVPLNKRYKEMEKLSSKLKEHITLNCDEVIHTRHLNKAFVTVMLMSDARQSYLPVDTSRFSESYEKLACRVNMRYLENVCKIFKEFKFLVPGALQCFASTLLSSNDCSWRSLTFYLDTCAFLNFKPTQLSDLLEIVSKKLTVDLPVLQEVHIERSSSKLLHKQDIKHLLKVAWNFSILEFFPETILNFIFSSEFMKIYECAIAGNRNYKEMLLSLNRSLVLECPDLHVPWFHEEGDTRNTQMGSLLRSTGNATLLQIAVQQKLDELLGGSEYYKLNQLLPYLYLVDFECAITRNKEPVAISNWKRQTDLERIAIVLLTTADFCMNVNQILGPVEMKLRHLEIMGYRVVQVPYYRIIKKQVDQNNLYHTVIDHDGLTACLSETIFR